jgi:hypothetical protein
MGNRRTGHTACFLLTRRKSRVGSANIRCATALIPGETSPLGSIRCNSLLAGQLQSQPRISPVDRPQAVGQWTGRRLLSPPESLAVGRLLYRSGGGRRPSRLCDRASPARHSFASVARSPGQARLGWVTAPPLKQTRWSLSRNEGDAALVACHYEARPRNSDCRLLIADNCRFQKRGNSKSDPLS